MIEIIGGVFMYAVMETIGNESISVLDTEDLVLEKINVPDMKSFLKIGFDITGYRESKQGIFPVSTVKDFRSVIIEIEFDVDKGKKDYTKIEVGNGEKEGLSSLLRVVIKQNGVVDTVLGVDFEHIGKRLRNENDASLLDVVGNSTVWQLICEELKSREIIRI
jgi:hypothetical protein